MCDVESLSKRHKGMLCQYMQDMHAILSEIERVLVEDGKAIFVVGNSTLHENFIRNSDGIKFLADQIGFETISSRRRPLPESRRYLPPPSSSSAGKQLKKRMREEVILTFLKN
jgi:hypothetical protein